MALKRGLIKCTGKTPEATMASALYTDIKRKEGQSIFIRPHEGLFGLREWIEQGVAFQVGGRLQEGGRQQGKGEGEGQMVQAEEEAYDRAAGRKAAPEAGGVKPSCVVRK